MAHGVDHVEKLEEPDRWVRLGEDTPYTRTLVFTRTKHGARRSPSRGRVVEDEWLSSVAPWLPMALSTNMPQVRGSASQAF